MTQPSRALEILTLSLDAMQQGPRPLDVMAVKMAHAVDAPVPAFTLAELVAAIRDPGRANPLGLRLRRSLVSWDCADDAPWAGTTTRCTAERRALVYDALALAPELRSACDDCYPVQQIGIATVIAEKHVRWYEPVSMKGFYAKEHERYLREQLHWPEVSIVELDRSTTEILERLANPVADEAYQSKGLVVGYVQSGKTANFTGVIAKAADAGYRLVIVLAGQLNVLRDQTQRRVDKELIGQELLAADPAGNEYAADPELNEFVKHGGMPSELGAFDWVRLTGPEREYRTYREGAGVLGVPLVDAQRRINHPVNIASAPAKLIIVKKNALVLRHLIKDLGALPEKQRLGVPVLIIDDESDQASIYTGRRTSTADERRKRKDVNKAIVDLLGVLGRAQYVGYTATPFANVFVNPDDSEDIFPKDFIVSLSRPSEYMGVSDFFDMEEVPDTFDDSNEKAFVRSVRGGDELEDNLLRALDSYVLAGALKLYRLDRDPSLARHLKHHTMLVHRSQWKVAHAKDAGFVEQLFEAADYRSAQSMERLRDLFDSDFAPVMQARGGTAARPATFIDLEPCVNSCLDKLDAQEKLVRIVNGDNKDDTPNFEQDPVWSILVGGAKLSRGYTIEGLTISYYRRAARAGDTLMQMGRWFGFRRGYRDLVRLFVGREEVIAKPKQRTNRKVRRRARRSAGPDRTKMDLLEAFKGLCRDEEEFRDELRRYASLDEPRVTPKMIPPLVPFHILPPTSPNKMQYARRVQINFGGKWRDPTSAPTDQELDRVESNAKEMATLLRESGVTSDVELRATIDQRAVRFDAHLSVCNASRMREFLGAYRWTERDDGLLQRELEYLEGRMGDPEVDDWLIVAPQMRKEATRSWPSRDEDYSAGALFAVRQRPRVGGEFNRYKVYTESAHKQLAEYVVGLRGATKPNDGVTELVRPRRGVMLFYPVSDTKGGEEIISIGFSLLFPRNSITAAMRFQVEQAART